MGLFKNQFSNVVEWEEYRDDLLFWKWKNDEIKKGSKLIIRAGQDAVFLFNGKVEGIFKDEGSFDIESEIVPFLSTLKGFKFGFNSGMRAEVLFINTKEILVKWGTKNAVSIPAPGLPGGMPVRAFGTFNCRVADHAVLIDKIAGIRDLFTVDDVKDRVISMLDQLLMKWISQEGKDMFNLQANAFAISRGIEEDLDMQMRKIGIGITGFATSSFSYPEEIRKMQEKAASQAMVSDVNKYQQLAAADAMASGSGGSAAGDMVGLQMGMMMGQQMIRNMQGQGAVNADGQPLSGNTAPQSAQTSGADGRPAAAPKFCSQCGAPVQGGKFCSNCGAKLC